MTTVGIMSTPPPLPSCPLKIQLLSWDTVSTLAVLVSTRPWFLSVNLTPRAVRYPTYDYLFFVSLLCVQTPAETTPAVPAAAGDLSKEAEGATVQEPAGVSAATGAEGKAGSEPGMEALWAVAAAADDVVAKIDQVCFDANIYVYKYID